MTTISLFWILIYLLIAVACIPLVRLIGPVAINYVLEETYDNDTGKLNVIYRILSPMLCCNAALCLSTLLAYAMGWPLPSLRWLPIFLYWLILAIIKTANNRMTNPFLAYILEAFVSIALAILFDYFVTDGFLKQGIDVFDQSNFAFELEIAVFYVIVQVIVSLIIRHQYRVEIQNSFLSKGSIDGHSYSYHPGVDTSEKALFSYERRFGGLLPDRYGQDPLLRDVFFAIMAIEDFNRPPTIRFGERIACAVGLAKTTGIMQQAGGKPLTDDESVLLATQYIERMWDTFLEIFSKSLQSNFDSKTIRFAQGWYEYDYQVLADVLEESFSALYGDYCGSRVLDVNQIFHEVRCFEERNRYNLQRDRVIVSGRLFQAELQWLSCFPAYWRDGYTICTANPNRAKGETSSYELVSNVVTSQEMNSITSVIKKEGYDILEVTFADKVFGKIYFIGPKDLTPHVESCKWEITVIHK